MSQEMNEVKINVIENIVTWQGEGKDCGQRMLLLRFKECDRVVNKKPCPWCDTLVKMRSTVPCQLDLLTIQQTLKEEKVGLMITGGEPLYDTNFRDTLSLINLDYPICNIETNGYNLDKFLITASLTKPWRVSFSPKIFDEVDFEFAKNMTSKILLNKNLDKKVSFKLVASEDRLMIKYMKLLDSANANHRVFIMPQGKNLDELRKNAPLAFDMAEKYKFNFSSREHLIYGFI